MNILYVLPQPDIYAGTERSMQLGAQAVQVMGNKIYLLHQEGAAARTSALYDGSLGMQDLFARSSYFDPKGLLEEEREVDRFIFENKIDVIHVHNWPRSSSLGRWARKYPVVATAHVALCPNNSRYLWKERCACDRKIGLACLTTGYRKLGCGHLGNGKPYGLPGFVRSMGEDWLLRQAIGSCTRIIAPSEWMKERLATDGMPKDIIRVLQEPIEGGEAPILPDTPSVPPVIAFVGRLVDFKGPDHLIHASRMIKSPHQIWVIGEGPMRVELEQLVTRLKISDRVTFFGMCEPAEVTQLRLKSSVVVVPSLWPDNFPMVGPEAMLLKKPVVAYKTGGIPEWLKDGVTGRLVNAGDIPGLMAALQEIIEHPEKARAMGEAGHVLASEWRPAKHGERLMEIYQEAIKQSQLRNLVHTSDRVQAVPK